MIKTLMGSIRDYMKVAVATPLLVLGEVLCEMLIPFITANLIDAKHFAVKTADATIQVDPERSYLVEARIIDGRRYLLVPADESVEVNGLGVRIAARDSGETN